MRQRPPQFAQLSGSWGATPRRPTCKPLRSGHWVRASLAAALWFGIGLVVPLPTMAAEPAPKPSFVLVLADDLGWGDLACYGHPRIQTPHLDQLAKDGMRFTQCYAACSVCSPSRSAILTGRTPYRNGVFRWIPEKHECHLRTSELALPKLLKAHGYETCHAGKWHLNGHFNSSEQPQPNDHGYDHWLATQNNAAPHHVNPTNFVRNGTAIGATTGASSGIVVDEVIGWLEKRASATAPVFVTVWTHEPHLPIESLPQYQAPYADLSDPDVRQHHGNVTQLDAAVGKLLKALDDLGRRDNTFVFFTSDNGPEGDGSKGRTRGSTGGLRSRKRATYEGGIRVPGIWRWPGRVPAGVVNETPVIGTDLFATVLTAAKVPLPNDRVLDSANLLPLLAGQDLARPQPLYWRNHLAPAETRVGMRVGDWKILGSNDLTRFELYNLKTDPQESQNLAEAELVRLQQLKEQLIAHDRAVLAEGPDWWRRDPSPDARPKATKKAAE